MYARVQVQVQRQRSELRPRPAWGALEQTETVVIVRCWYHT